DDMVRALRAVHVVPLLQWPLLALDDQQRLAGEDEEALLVGLPVIHGHRLAGLEHVQVCAELRPVLVALDVAGGSAAFAVQPAHVARVDDVPSLALRDEAVLLGLDLRFVDHYATAAPVACAM